MSADLNDDTICGGLVEELRKAAEPPDEAPAAEESPKEEAVPAPAPDGALPAAMAAKIAETVKQATGVKAAPTGPLPPLGTPEELLALVDDVRALGALGVLLAISDAPPPSDEVADEIPKKLAERLRAQLEGESVPESMPLPELISLFRAKKGEKAGLVLRKSLENAIFEFYELKEHGLFVDDVGRILDVLKSTIGASDNAQTFLKRLSALSSDTAIFLLGTLPEQLQLIYKIKQREAERHEIDAAFDGFSPRVIWKRVFAIQKALLEKEKRFRLALTIHGRLRGVSIGREQTSKMGAALAVKDTRELQRRLLASKDARRVLKEREAERAATIRAVEALY